MLPICIHLTKRIVYFLQGIVTNLRNMDKHYLTLTISLRLKQPLKDSQHHTNENAQLVTWKNYLRIEKVKIVI